MIFKVLLLYFSSVYSALIPGDNVNFVTKSGYKYTGEPEVDTCQLTNGQTIKKPKYVFVQKTVTLESDKNALEICSHHCILNKDSSFECNGYFVEGTLCSLVSDTSAVEKDGISNNFFIKGTASPIPPPVVVNVYNILIILNNILFVQSEDDSIQNPVEEPVEEPDQNPSEDPVEEPIQNPIEEPVEEPVQNPAK